MKYILIILSLFSSIQFANSQNIYNLDQDHSKVGFSATHFGISHVEGRFKTFSATLTSNKTDFTDALIEMTAEITSIDTDIRMRDNDLKSENWFDASKYPTITFKSTSFKKIDDKNYTLNGNITMHGITKTISLTVLYNGTALNPTTKKNSFGFTITGKLNRKDFSIGTGAGSLAVSNEIELISNVEFTIDNTLSLIEK